MKRFWLVTALVMWCTAALQGQSFESPCTAGGVRFETGYESSSLGAVQLLDSVWVRQTLKDSVLHLSYRIDSRMDPANPADPELEPSARWFAFRMVGVKDKHIYLNFTQTDPQRAVYSYDGATYTRFESYRAALARADEVFTQDTVYIAYSYPYTYGYLQQRLQDWLQCPDVRMDTIGYSLQGLPLQRLVITDPRVAESQKTRVWIHARTHPGETPGSWQLDGLIDALTAATPQGQALRSASAFYIVPFSNPDGVYGGYSRSNARGINQEVNWDQPDSLTGVEVQALRTALQELWSKGPVDLALNVHSQSQDGISYYIHKAAATSDAYFEREMQFMYFTCARNPYMRPEDAFYSSPAPKYVEGWFWGNYPGQAIALTLETPYSFYKGTEPQEWVTPASLRHSGERVLLGIADFFRWNLPDRYLVNGVRKGAKTICRVPALPAGTYSLARWTGSDWQPEGEVNQKKTARYQHKVKADGTKEAVALWRLDRK